MTRLAWPHAFLLQCAELTAAHQKGLTKSIADSLLPQPLAAYGPPVALRWTTHPALGFPRAPFSVYRAPALKPEVPLIDGLKTVDGSLELAVAGDLLYEIRFFIAPTTGKTIVAEALDAGGRAIPGQRIVFTANGLGAMRCPGIAALRLTGAGKITSFLGVTASAVANQPKQWQRIAVVGLPFGRDALPPQHYDTWAPQGHEPPRDTGLVAAATRLTAERGLALPLPAFGDPAVPVLDWPTPEPADLLDQLHRRSGPVDMIMKCLGWSDDLDPARQQVSFLYEHVLEGIHQLGHPLPPGTEPAVAKVPVVAVTQLAVSSDSELATALGYGFIDFPPPRQEDGLVWPPGLQPPPFIYMVDAVFHSPWSGAVTIAGLSQCQRAPAPAASLAAATVLHNCPPGIDQHATDAVELSWTLATPPAAYVLAVSRRPGHSRILNARRISAKGHDLYVPQRPTGPDGLPPPDARTRFIDLLAEAPFTGSETHGYFVLARDVFARWATWSEAQHTISAPEVTRPGLNSVSLAPVDPAPPAGAPSTVRCDLTIEVVWDWSDRAPAKIVLTGRFFAGTAPASYLLGLELNDALGGDSPLVLTFAPDRTPIVPNPSKWQAWRISPPSDACCVYRVIVHDVLCDFAVAFERSYAVYARGYEVVRPGSASAVVGPRTGKAFDPRPAAPPPLPEILWTALPDAAGQARALLTWPAVPAAAGYFIWEATESALRAAVSMPPVPAPVPGVTSQTLPERAEAIRVHLDGPPSRHAKSLVAFTRLHERVLTATQIELELPGAADTLYAYRISTITPAGVESARSTDVAFIGVPRRAVPGEPSLLLRRTPAGVRLYARRGGGHLPAGFAVHRVLNPRATAEVGLMGPPVHAHTSPLWRAAAAGDPALRGQDPGQFQVLDDPVPTRWDPYFYRIVAIGEHDPYVGKHAGRSRASALQSIVHPPADPPWLEDPPTFTPPSAGRVLTFRTDLPIRACPLGPATILIATFSISRVLERLVILECRADQVAVGPPYTPGTATTKAQILRGAPDDKGHVTYSVLLPGTVARGAITVIDPLGRATEVSFPEAS